MALLSIYEPTTEAIERFVQVAFKSQDSLFTPGSKIWSPEIRADLYKRLVSPSYDSSGGDFMQEFERQLKDAPRETIQLAAELLYVQLLTPNRETIKHKTKERLVTTVLSWSGAPAVVLPVDLNRGLDGGLATDQWFLANRRFHLKYILETLRAWWDNLDNARRNELLSDPWEFKRFMEGIKATKAKSIREILCFFVHRLHFEAITSHDKKEKFAKEFRDRIESSTGDIDKDLLAIRAVLSKTYGEQFHFFESRIRDGKPLKNGTDGEVKESEGEMKALLEQFGQIIVYGPPGTGKTREAKRVALALLTPEEADTEAASTDMEIEEKLDPFRKKDRFDLVVFHPAYEYEQFVGGIEPQPVQQLSFKAKAGVFTRLCRKAQNSTLPTVLIIDEINRGNLPKLLGELVYALEYRGHKVRLPFDDGCTDLVVPKNLYVIATMNSSDRSIGHIDVAIRRRFGLYPLGASPEVVQRVWSSAGDKPYGGRLAVLMKRLNEKLGSGHDPSIAVELGVGHSYFLPAPGSSGETAKKQVQMKWAYQVQPLLREYAQLLNLGADSLQEFFKPLDQCVSEP